MLPCGGGRANWQGVRAGLAGMVLVRRGVRLVRALLAGCVGQGNTRKCFWSAAVRFWVTTDGWGNPCSREVSGRTCSPGQGPTHRHPRASTFETTKSLVQGTSRVVVKVPLQRVLIAGRTSSRPMERATRATAPSVSGVSSSDSHSSMTAPWWAAIVETRGARAESAGCYSATFVES